MCTPLKAWLRSKTKEKWQNYWNKKTPYRKAVFIYKVADYSGNTVGVPFFHTEKKNLYTYITYVGVVFYFIEAAYTVSNNVALHQFDKACYPLCTIGACTLVELHSSQMTFIIICP